MKDILENIKLLKKYHTNLVYDYTEYPTKSNWKEDFNESEYKKSLKKWFKENYDRPIVFYIHTPFCEQLCYFCLCSKEITRNYENVKVYLYDYLFKEIDLLTNFFKKNEIPLNIKEIYLGGGSPTYYKEEEFKNLVNKLKEFINFNKIGDFSIEIDPRRVDEKKLLFYSEMGINRLSFGIQDFDLKVQEEINRVQPPELIEKLLTNKVREKFSAINFDLLIGLPSQTAQSISKTIKKVSDLKPTQIQTMYMHYKPQTRKYMVRMLRNGPLPDFYDRKAIFAKASKELKKSGYNSTGFEMWALPNDIISKSYKQKKAYYGSLGTQKGEVKDFIGIGSSAHSCLGNEYYFQNYYEQNLYRQSIRENKLPIYRGMKLSKDDMIRQKIVKDLRTFFEINFEEINKIFSINFNDYFSKELKNLKIYENDGLVKIFNDKIKLSELGIHFSPQIANAFDAYDDQKIYLN